MYVSECTLACSSMLSVVFLSPTTCYDVFNTGLLQIYTMGFLKGPHFFVQNYSFVFAKQNILEMAQLYNPVTSLQAVDRLLDVNLF